MQAPDRYFEELALTENKKCERKFISLPPFRTEYARRHVFRIFVQTGSPGRTRTYNPPVTSSPYVSIRLGLSLYPVKTPSPLPSPQRERELLFTR